MLLNDRSEIDKSCKNLVYLLLLGNETSSRQQKKSNTFAIYSFCREVDDIADNLQSPRDIKQKNLKVEKTK